MKLVWLLVILMIPGLFSYGRQIRNFTKTEYKAASQNWSVDFADDGFAYFGNNLGLLEFDGVSWELYPSPNGSIIRTVAVSGDKIYTAGYRELGYWQRKPGEPLKYSSLRSHVDDQFTTNEEFWNIMIHGDSVIFQSFTKIFVYYRDSFYVVKNKGFIQYSCIVGGKPAFVLRNKGVYFLSGMEDEPYIEHSLLDGKNIRFILPFGNNQILVGTENHGIYMYYPDRNVFKEWAPELKDYFMQNTINRGIKTSGGYIVVGTILDGVVALNRSGNRIFRFNKKNGLQNNTALDIKEDIHGNLWLTLDKGIDFISISSTDAVRIFSEPDLGALYSAQVYNEKLYVGTNQGLFYKSWKNDQEEFALVPNTQEQVWECKVVDSALFVGHNKGTFLIKGDRAKMISSNSGGYSITEVPNRPNTLLQCTYSNLVVYTKQNGDWKMSHTIKGYNNLIHYINFDHVNNLWASHLYSGLYRIRLNENLDSVLSIRSYGPKIDPDGNEQNLNVFEVENRIVFTDTHQMYTYDDLNDSIVPYDFLNDNLKKYKTSMRIIPAPDHGYWFICKEGIACFEIRDRTVRKIKEYPMTLFNHQLISGFENVIPINREEALVCLDNGYALVNTRFKGYGDEILDKKLRVRRIEASDRKDNSQRVSPNSESIVLPFNKNNLDIRYSFPFFSASRIRFQYKISGVSDWSEPHERPIFNIRRIPHGDYVLQVRAINDWGKFSQVNKTKLVVKPPLYRSGNAFIFYAAVFLLLFFITRNVTIKRVKVNEKRKRLDKERELIKLRNEKLRAELTYKSEQLANSTMGMIKKNEFLMSLKNSLKNQKEQLGFRYPDKYYYDLIQKIDNHISNQDDWKIFESNFEKAHEEFLKTLKSNYPDLTPSDLRLCAYLRMNLTSKEIAPLLGISVRGVENHRYRLRKKLNLESEDNLTEFILTM